VAAKGRLYVSPQLSYLLLVVLGLKWFPTVFLLDLAEIDLLFGTGGSGDQEATMSGGRRQYLSREFNLRQPLRVRYHWWVFGFTMLIIVFFAGTGAWMLYTRSNNLASLSLVAVGVAIAGAVLTYDQWRKARMEITLDKFYERLNYSNQRLMDLTAARAMLAGYPVTDEEPNIPKVRAGWQEQMYIFIELDNLEYAVQKYELGFMHQSLMSRAINTFRSRCFTSEVFRRRALATVVDRQATGHSDYTQQTRAIVASINQEIERELKSESPSSKSGELSDENRIASA
jgi:hypothetical protein